MWLIFPTPTPPFFPYFLLYPRESIPSSEPWCKIGGSGAHADTCLLSSLLFSPPFSASPLPSSFGSPLLCTRHSISFVNGLTKVLYYLICLITSWDCHKAEWKERLLYPASCIQSAFFKGYIFLCMDMFSDLQKSCRSSSTKNAWYPSPASPKCLLFTPFAVSYSFSCLCFSQIHTCVHIHIVFLNQFFFTWSSITSKHFNVFLKHREFRVNIFLH